MPRFRVRSLLAVWVVLAVTAPGSGHTPPQVGETAPARSNPACTDRHGDPLPPGVIARLGTVRLRMSGPVTDLAFFHDGRTLAANSYGEVHLWDASTGKRLKHLYKGGYFSFAFATDGKTLA